MNQQIIFIFRYHSSCIKWFSKWFSLYLKDLFKNIFAPLLGVDGSQPPENRARWTRVEFTSELIIFAGSCFDKFVVTPLQRKTIWKIKTKQKARMNLHRLDYSWEFCRFSQTLQTFWIQWSLCRFQRRFRIIWIDGKKDMIKMLHVSVPHLKIEKYRQYNTDDIRQSCSHFNQTDQNQPEMTSMHGHFASKTVT